MFNLELDEGLQSSYATGLDQDEFDAHCDHLIVEHVPSGNIIGTYRMQDRRMADAGAGFYSANEFQLARLGEDVLASAVELGRACIDVEHRNTRVLFLLWRGLAAYMVAGGHRYFFGCCSLTSRDARDGTTLFNKLRAQGAVDDARLVDVTRGFLCDSDIDDPALAPKIPKLMRLYIAYGARIVSPPALDREFGTIDFLALFDLHTLNEQARGMFLDER